MASSMDRGSAASRRRPREESSSAAQPPLKWQKFPIITPPDDPAFNPYVAPTETLSNISKRESQLAYDAEKLPEHRLYHTCKFVGQQPKAKHSKLRFLRDEKPAYPKMEEEEPAPGSRASKVWHRQRRIAHNRWIKEVAKPPGWRMQDPKLRQTWVGKPEAAWGTSRQKVKKKRYKFLLLEFLPDKNAFACHSVSKYSFTKVVGRRQRTIEEAEAEMKALHKRKDFVIGGGKIANLEEKIIYTSEASESSNPVKSEEAKSIFKHKKNSETYDIYSTIKPEEGCYDGHNSDDNPEEQEVGEEKAEEMTFEERQNMTKKQAKLNLGLSMLNDGKSLEAVSKEVTDKTVASASIPHGDAGVNDANAEFDEFFRDERESDPEDSEGLSLSDWDSDSGAEADRKPKNTNKNNKAAAASSSMDIDTHSSSSNKPKSKNSIKKTKNPEPMKEEEDEEESEDEDEDSSEEEEDDAVHITAQDIKAALRASSTGRLEVLQLTVIVKSKLTTPADRAQFKKLIRELCVVTTDPTRGKTFVILKEEQEKTRQRAIARQKREILREKKRQEKARMRTQRQNQ